MRMRNQMTRRWLARMVFLRAFPVLIFLEAAAAFLVAWHDGTDPGIALQVLAYVLVLTPGACVIMYWLFLPLTPPNRR
jgi:hypothetical protein